MEQTLIDAGLAQNVWAGFAIALVFYVLKKQEVRDTLQAEREARYQDIVKQLTEEVAVVKVIQEDVKEIKTIVRTNG